jgi:hypothetical protein
MSLNAPVAQAFSDPAIYGQYPTKEKEGGGGRFFTGSPAEGYDCSVCHTGQGSFPVYQTGLPLDGYIPGQPYLISLTWPEATNAFLLAKQQQLDPRTGLVAELVAEDGSGSGKIDSQRRFAHAPEDMAAGESPQYCLPQAGVTETLYAAPMYHVAAEPGAPAVEVPDPRDSTKGPPGVCDSDEPGERCLVALKACGAQALKFRWTAPPRWRGPIWFSLGFVTTYNSSGAPNDADFVTTMSIPMNAKSDGSQYESSLESGCSVGRAGAAHSGSPAGGWMFGLIALGLGLRARRRALAAIGGGVLLSALCTGCADESAVRTRTDPLTTVGLFEPTEPRDGGYDAGPPPKCPSMYIPEDDAGVHPGGMLAIDFTTAGPPGAVSQFDKIPGENRTFGAVWLEDDMGRFVKTLEYWGLTQFTLGSLNIYFGVRPIRGCTMDVMAQPTITMHRPHALVWDGKDLNGHVVPDGNYKLTMQIQIDELHRMDPVVLAIVKGRMPWTLQPPPAPPQVGMTLTYTPSN